MMAKLQMEKYPMPNPNSVWYTEIHMHYTECVPHYQNKKQKP
jgi:hypothetical protein